jgi:hypothetical protein
MLGNFDLSSIVKDPIIKKEYDYVRNKYTLIDRNKKGPKGFTLPPFNKMREKALTKFEVEDEMEWDLGVLSSPHQIPYTTLGEDAGIETVERFSSSEREAYSAEEELAEAHVEESPNQKDARELSELMESIRKSRETNVKKEREDEVRVIPDHKNSPRAKKGSSPDSIRVEKVPSPQKEISGRVESVTPPPQIPIKRRKSSMRQTCPEVFDVMKENCTPGDGSERMAKQESEEGIDREVRESFANKYCPSTIGKYRRDDKNCQTPSLEDYYQRRVVKCFDINNKTYFIKIRPTALNAMQDTGSDTQPRTFADAVKTGIPKDYHERLKTTQMQKLRNCEYAVKYMKSGQHPKPLRKTQELGFIYMESKKLRKNEIRTCLRTIGIDTGRVIDINFAGNNITVLTVPSGLINAMEGTLKKNGMVTISFDPLSREANKFDKEDKDPIIRFAERLMRMRKNAETLGRSGLATFYQAHMAQQLTRIEDTRSQEERNKAYFRMNDEALLRTLNKIKRTSETVIEAGPVQCRVQDLAPMDIAAVEGFEPVQCQVQDPAPMDISPMIEPEPVWYQVQDTDPLDMS